VELTDLLEKKNSNLIPSSNEEFSGKVYSTFTELITIKNMFEEID
jgi:hypothetical protein